MKKLCICLFLALTACQPVTLLSSTSTPLPPTPSTLPVPLTTEPSPFFIPIQTEPVFPRDQQPWFADVVEPGAVIFHEGQFHLFFNGFTGWPGKVAIGYATSSDGINWTLASANPILDSAVETFEGYTFFVSSALVGEDGTWILYLYTLAEGRDGAPGAILRATSADPGGDWSLDPAPILAPGGEGKWDAVRVTDPSVIRTPDGYRMYYTGADTDRLQATRMIGLATSPDGITWTKHPEPVLAPDFPSASGGVAWDAFRVFQPHVIQTPNGYAMLYKANIKIGEAEAFGFAHSQDGVIWEKSNDNPIVEEKTYGLDWLRKGYAEFLFHEGMFFLYLEVLEREGGPYAHGNTDYFSNIMLLKNEGK